MFGIKHEEPDTKVKEEFDDTVLDVSKIENDDYNGRTTKSMVPGRVLLKNGIKKSKYIYSSNI